MDVIGAISASGNRGTNGLECGTVFIYVRDPRSRTHRKRQFIDGDGGRGALAGGRGAESVETGRTVVSDDLRDGTVRYAGRYTVASWKGAASAILELDSKLADFSFEVEFLGEISC